MDSKTAGDLCLALLIGEEDPKQLAADMLAKSVYVTANRNGFMRRVLAKQVLTEGLLPSWRASSKSRMAATAVRYDELEVDENKVLHFSPPEFSLQCRPGVKTDNGDRFADMLSHAEEAMYVAEDRLLCLMLQPNAEALDKKRPMATIDHFLDTATFYPSVLAVGAHVYNALLGDADFTDRCEFSSVHDDIATGVLGSIKSKDRTKEVAVVTDAYRHPEHRIFQFDTLALLGSPLELGQYTDRDGYEGAPVLMKDGDKVEFAGVFLSSILSMVINPACYLRVKEQ